MDQPPQGGAPGTWPKAAWTKRKPNLREISLQMPLWMRVPGYKSPPVRTQKQTLALLLWVWPCGPTEAASLSSLWSSPRDSCAQVLKWTKMYHHGARFRLLSQQQPPDPRCVLGLAAQRSLTEWPHQCLTRMTSGGQVLPTKQLAGLFSRAPLFTLISHGSHAGSPAFCVYSLQMISAG